MLGFSGDPLLAGGDSATASIWIDRAVAEGAGIVRVDIGWSQVAPTRRPPNFDASNPGSPEYNWTEIDAAVRELHAHGLKILLEVYSAPAWAEGPHMPARERPGTWRPSAADYAAFATAAARRYDGHYPDPLHPGSDLPRVRYWQAWNEPNLDHYLSPQWTRSGRRWLDTSPVIYRRLLNAFYAAVKRVSASNFVVSAGDSPYGESSPEQARLGHQRMPPVEFYRDVLCLNGAAPNASAQPAPRPCPNPPHLDALDQHIYAIHGPLWHALNADDVATPDVYKLARVLDRAERTGRVLPHRPKALWVTEISWASRPPNPGGVPLGEHARWYEQAMHVLWLQGVSTVLFLDIRDSTAPPQGGLYFMDGQPKPAATAYRFPFLSQRLSAGEIQAWGRSPQTGSLRVERLRGDRWLTLRTLHVRRHEVFLTRIALRGAAVLRAQVDGQSSLTWSQSR